MKSIYDTRFGAIIVLALAASACSKQDGEAAPGGGGQMPPTDVSASQVVKKQITEWDEFTGRIEAKETVEIRPRVGGYLNKVHFEEGKLVEKGQLLFSIDDREYRAALDSAQANVLRARARAERADTELSRSNKLLVAKAVSAEEVAARKSEVLQAVADVRGAEAAVVQARLNLEFTRIESPISGRIGVALLRPGNLLAPGTSVLTSVVSLTPVYVYFEGDERTYLKYQNMAREGERPSSREAQNPVRMGLANEDGYPHQGYMDMVDNQLNPQTGSIRARAVFDNKDGIFTPGLFARIQLLGSGAREALLIHDRAILTDQSRKFVYVIGKDNTAQRKDIEIGAQADGLRIVTAGLDGSEQVVVNGTNKIFFPGAPVKALPVPMDNPDFQPATASKAEGSAQ
jgi:membrane fusion protein, multidrug efflux system